MASFGLGRPGPPATSQDSTHNTTPIDASTPWMAASEGNLSLLQSSLAMLQLPPTMADENGYTLLHAAASYNQIATMEYLLRQIMTHPASSPADYVNASDQDGDTALHYAGSVDSARFLVQHCQANASQVNRQHKTPLEAKRDELNELMQDEEADDDDDEEDVETLKALVEYLAGLDSNPQSCG